MSNPQEIVGNALAGGSLWGRNGVGYDAGGTYQFATSYSPAHQVRSKLGVKHAHPMCQLYRNQAWPPSSSIPFYAADDCNANNYVSIHNVGGNKLWGSIYYWSNYVDAFVGTSDYSTTNHIVGNSVVGGIEDSITPQVDSGDATNIPTQSWNLRRGIWYFEWGLAVDPRLSPTDGDGHSYSWSMDVAPSRLSTNPSDDFFRGFRTTRVDRDHPNPTTGLATSSGTFKALFRITNEWIVHFRLGVQASLTDPSFAEGDTAIVWNVFAHRLAYLPA